MGRKEIEKLNRREEGGGGREKEEKESVLRTKTYESSYMVHPSSLAFHPLKSTHLPPLSFPPSLHTKRVYVHVNPYFFKIKVFNTLTLAPINAITTPNPVIPLFTNISLFTPPISSFDTSPAAIFLDIVFKKINAGKI